LRGGNQTIIFWHIKEFPSDFKDGTGNDGPYLHNYNDPEGGEIGKYSLNINPSAQVQDS